MIYQISPDGDKNGNLLNTLCYCTACSQNLSNALFWVFFHNNNVAVIRERSASQCETESQTHPEENSAACRRAILELRCFSKATIKAEF